jgi:ribosomal protein L29
MAKQGNINDLFSGFNFFMPDSSTMFPVNDLMSSGMKLMEEASEISKEFMFKGFDGSDFFSFFQNTAEVMTSSYSGYLEMMGFISKDSYDQLIEKYNEIQKELTKYKRQGTQKENKLKDQDKKVKALEKEISSFKKKIDELEKELAAEKITKATSTTKASKAS